MAKGQKQAAPLSNIIGRNDEPGKFINPCNNRLLRFLFLITYRIKYVKITGNGFNLKT